MRRGTVRAYVLRRLYESLSRIGIGADCTADILKLLSNLSLGADNGSSLAGKVSEFQSLWRRHLDRAYLEGYEETRWNFLSEYVLGKLQDPQSLGRCLDIGCGRGCITAQFATGGRITEIVGIDAADFSSEWRERLSITRRAVRFDRVPVGLLDSWLPTAGQFDTVLMFYVLHHSNELWAARTLRNLRPSLRPQGRIIVLEDSLIGDKPPISDPFKLVDTWHDWAISERLFTLTSAFDAQVVLDFVAVQLLAGYYEVRMPCNYRLGKDWNDFFCQLGYQVVQSENIGFPLNRDIDVPQGFFVLQLD
jgi:SAM-dependent methyltransferase